MPIDNKKIQELVNRKLARKEEIGSDQIILHLQRARQYLTTAQAIVHIDEEVAYGCAYQAMLKTARALMFSAGYRPIDGAQHRTAVVFAGIILGPEYDGAVKQFDDMRKTRNDFTYAPSVPVSLTEAEAAIQAAHKWVAKVSSVIAAKNPQLKLFD